MHAGSEDKQGFTWAVPMRPWRIITTNYKDAALTSHSRVDFTMRANRRPVMQYGYVCLAIVWSVVVEGRVDSG